MPEARIELPDQLDTQFEDDQLGLLDWACPTLARPVNGYAVSSAQFERIDAGYLSPGSLVAETMTLLVVCTAIVAVSRHGVLAS